MNKPVKSILQELLQCHTLTHDEAKEIMLRISKGELNEAQIAALLTVYMMRHITVDELLGFREAILELCHKVNLSAYHPIDVCGTGGDGRNTFNISTLTTFVLAGAGIKVAKHGNYGVSSVSGSSNMMEYFGYKFSNDSGKLKKEIESAGICFLHAPLFHPALKAVAPVRKQLGIRTFFNMLGPLVNPSNPPAQVTGVFNFELQRIYHFIFQQEKKKYNVIFSTDGYDEISLTSPVKICSAKGESLVHPEEMGFEKIKPESLSGGETVKDAAKIFQRVLDNKCTKPQRDVVVANTAIAIQTATGKLWDESKNLASRILEIRQGEKKFSKINQPAMNILQEIKQHKLREVAERKSLYPVKLLERSIYYQAQPVSLKKYLLRQDLTGIIAEFKRKSPSKGIINQYAEPAATCLGYMQAGASALSVLTDEKYFGGSADDLRSARKFNYCPILRKDFIVDEYQIVEARSMGADVVLLIAEMLEKKEIQSLAKFAVSVGLEVLLEFHSKDELKKLNENIHHAGVNNRDLKTFTVDTRTSYELSQLIPTDFIKISESGIEEATTVFALRKAGYQGFLIGEYFMRHSDPAAACERFIQSVRNYEKVKA